MAFNLRGVIALDGEAELRKAVTNINSSLRELKSELANTEEKFSGQANSMNALQSKYDTLSSAVEQSRQKQKALSEIIEIAKSKQKEAANELDKLNKKYEEAKKQLEEMKSSNSSSTEEITQQEQAVKDLSSQLGSAKKKYLDTETSVNKWNTSLNKAQTETSQFENELNKTGQYLDEAKSSANGCAVSIDEFGNETKEAATQTSSWADKLRGAVANKAVSLGIDTLKSSMQKLAEAAKEVVEVGSDFEASMSKVAAISGATGSDLDALTAKAKEMGESTKYTASEAADAFSYMALAGWDTEEMLSGIDGVLNLAAAADMDLAEASDIVTDYLTAFGLTAQDSAEFVDMMAYAMANSNTTVEDLGEAYKNCAATASSLGYSAEEVTAVLSTMANAGVKGGEAGTALNTIMTRLATNTKSCGDALAEYGVDIYDSEGNMNSLSSILEGMSGIWETLSDEQQANLAKTIAGTNQYSALQTVMSGLSDEAKKSGKSFSDYSEALEDCTGTAEEMAETMQDNLQGDMTKMESALQTLANEAYGYVSGPLRSAVQGVTSLIGGITDIISPQESELQSLVSSAQAAEAAVSASIENRNTTLAGAEQEATQVELLGNRLMELSGIENKTTAQKAEMEQIVEQLSGSIPELASAYDAETGSLSMTNEELQNYITAQKESIVTQAMLAANEDLIASLVEAQTQLDNVNNTIEDLSEQNDIYDSQIAEIEQLEQAYEDGTISQEEYQNGLMGIAMQYEDLLSSGQISMNTLGKDLQALKEDNSDTLDSLIEDQEEYQNTIDEGTEIINQNAESAQKLSDALLDAADSTEEASESTKNYALAVEDSAESVDESTESFYENSLSMDNAMEAAGLYSDGMKRAAASTDSLAETSEDAADSTEDLESSLDDATTAAEKAAEAYDDAFNNIYDAYTSTMESIKSDLQNKLDLSSKFDGGDDNTTETMNANLESQVEGLKTYQENLEKVRQMTDETGQSIFSDELLSQIEGQGTDMANMLEHIVWTWENQGEYGAEQVQGIADKWTEYLDISDEIATAGAANETAYQLAMGELGSTDLDFSNLRENVEAAVEAAGEGWSGLTDETEAALQSAIDTAQSMGVQIPDGLAEAIASGETSAEQATEQLNSAIQGTLEGLLQVAEESGATVDETLVSSITNGTADAQSAMQTLMDAITDGTSDSGVGSAVETAVGEGTEAIEEASDTYSEGGGTLAESLAEGISENSDLITDAVTEALETGAEATDTVLESYTEAGKEVANAIADGITNNTGAIADALSDAIKDGMSGSGDSTGSGSDLGAAIVEAALESLNGSETMTAFEAAGNDAALAYNAALGAWGENAATEIQALVDSATSVLNDALTSYEAYGNEASGAYAYALASQGTAAADQAKALANQALAALEAQQNEFHTAGYNMSAGMAQGIASGASLAIEAAKNMASQALAAAKAELDIQSPSKKFKKDVGENIGKGMAFGIKDSANLATTEAETMSSKVYKKASAWLTKYKQSQEVSLSDEKYYWKQVLAHCEEGTSAYTKVLTKYNDTVAQIIKNGVSTTTTTGSGSNQKTVAKDTETYYSDVYEAAEDYMDKLQTISDVSLEEQLSYWKSVQKQLKKGTDAWYDAQKEINSINDEIYSEIVSEAEQALSNKKVLEDVSIQDEIDYWKEVRKQIVKEGGKYTDEWYEVTQTIKDLKDDYYDEIYSDAQTSLSNTKVVNDMSLKEELAYWQSVKKQLKKGTQAWYDAQSEINSIKEKIGTVSNASNLLSAYQTYFNMSELAEMEYWDAVRQQYEAGTDERLEADEKYFDAKEAYYDKLEELEEDYADAVKDIEEDLANNIADLTESYNDSLQERIDTIMNAYSLFDEFTSESADGKTLLFNLQSQAAGYEAWSDALDTLEARGILSEDLLEELTEMGPDQIAAIYALSDLTDEELTAYQEAYDKKMDAATKQAEEDTADLKAELALQTVELKEQAEKDKAETLKDYNEKLDAANKTITSELSTLANNIKTIAEDQTTAIVAALKNQDTKEGASSSLTSTSSSSTTSTSSSSKASTASSSSTSDKNAELQAQVEEEALKAQLLTVIQSGSKKTSITSAEKKSKSDLWLYLVENYKREPTTAIYTKLASLLGITLKNSNKTTSTERNKILKKLKAKGLRSGGRNIQDELIWMDEELETKGPEMIVRKSDNAILTRAQPGDDIIDADTTSNLLRLGKINPDDLMSVLAKQQEAALSYLDELNAAGSAQMNDLVSVGNAGMAASFPDISRMEAVLGEMESLMSEFLPYLAERQTIAMDGDKVVNSISDRMSTNMAMRSRRKRA